ncbi:hypothetical protein BVC80_379g94 [Macleaya cordata]|uniref:Uncharacterized protein n=1 Tax=Macleaya cordata TaxID=56857 RepID=A0A200QT07_MACCD|nr:hypothetical protein BVC80_379g94 [Macleaya cordata]
MGTEYLVRPVGRAEDEEDASDFEPGEENGEEEDDFAEEEEDQGDKSAGKGEAIQAIGVSPRVLKCEHWQSVQSLTLDPDLAVLL